MSSKLMCWVALDRGVKLADMLGYGGNYPYWTKNRDLVRDDLIGKGWNQKRRAFTQHYESEALDASTLLIPLYDFLPATDEKVQLNFQHTVQELNEGGLLRRYLAYDGLKGEEGSFLWCSFWVVRNLIKMERLDEAEELFTKLLTYGNHLGLFAEMVNGSTGEALGNFPQALTHLAVIQSALELCAARQVRTATISAPSGRRPLA